MTRVHRADAQDHALAITATDSNGQKKTVMLSLTIDNELNLGAAALEDERGEAMLWSNVQLTGAVLGSLPPEANPRTGVERRNPTSVSVSVTCTRTRSR
jgi:hypothetical protein